MNPNEQDIGLREKDSLRPICTPISCSTGIHLNVPNNSDGRTYRCAHSAEVGAQRRGPGRARWMGRGPPSVPFNDSITQWGAGAYTS
jgi:hypothetical protein